MPDQPVNTDPAMRTQPSGCCGPGAACGCGPQPAGANDTSLTRRSFVAATGLSFAGLVASAAGRPLRAIAGPFSTDPRDFPIPADKKLDPAWVRSLTDRGEPTVYSSLRDELKHIGMPVGGICTGQLYLGGDGRLWLWDIFNLPAPDEWRSTAGPHYAKPAKAESPIAQGFALHVIGDFEPRTLPLDSTGFRDISFRGEYPVGTVDYRDEASPVSARLEAFSPFIPLDEDDSGLPATVMSYTVTNTSSKPVTVRIAGWLQNAVCLATGKEGLGKRRNLARQEPWGAEGMKVAFVECTAEKLNAAEQPPPGRPDLMFENWEKGTYDGWTVTGRAFGDKPRKLSDIAAYQGNLAAQGEWTVNTHETRAGEDVVKADTYTGALTSRVFAVERDHISFRIGGGKHPGQACVNLLVDGAVVRTATGQNSNRMRIENWDVRELAGRQARIQIVDDFTGGWGQIGCDDIVLCDQPRREPFVLGLQPDYGSMTLALIGAGADGANAGVLLTDGKFVPELVFSDHSVESEAIALFGGKPLVGSVSGTAALAPGVSATFTFVLTWHFPNPWWDSLDYLIGARKLRRHYGKRFDDAAAVLKHVAENFERLSSQTRLWRDTWYDSTLPYWLLDRTFANVSTLATSTCYRFDNGRFYGWEGTYCCAGTCQHVWQYAQGVARIFPGLERWVRENIDFGLAFHEDTGAIDYRAEADRRVAHDGLAGTIIRAYREHTMSPDAAFLKGRWGRIRKSVELLIHEDADADGILEGAQYNTLDTTWYGPMGWVSSLYLGAVAAGRAMAIEMGDDEFAARCGAILERGSMAMVDRLFNGEYFIHVPDPAHPEANSTGTGCHIDQVFGQSMAFQAGLGRIIPERQSRSALASLYKYSFAPDIGPYREFAAKTIKGGRWYAMPGEGGLLMCTWPKGGEESATGKGGDAWAAGYFNECMSGFEHQAASHMVFEGLVQEGLAIERMIHDRYHASRRNPWNEVECSSHYARAMASYGVFIASCGFEHHGSKGHIAFEPRLSPENFRAPFTSCEGWGTFSQQRRGAAGAQAARIELKHGRLRLATLALVLPAAGASVKARASLGGQAVPCQTAAAGSRVTITFAEPIIVNAGEKLEVTVS